MAATKVSPGVIRTAIVAGAWALPAYAIWTGGLAAPPKYELSFAVICPAMGCLALVLLWGQREKIRSWRPSVVGYVAIMCLLVGVVLWLGYAMLLQRTVIEIGYGPTPELREEMYFPLWRSGDLQRGIDIAGGERRFAERPPGPYRVEQDVLNQPPNREYRYATTVVLAATLCLCFAAAYSAFAIPVLYFRSRFLGARRYPHFSFEDGPPHVFISYRRTDAGYTALCLSNDLRDILGSDKVFHDIHRVKPGGDFATELKSALCQCKALIAVIGPHWVDARDGHGARRLDDPQDWVCLEITTALARGIKVIPVLVDSTPLLEAHRLPAELSRLPELQVIRVTNNLWRTWENAVETLVLALNGTRSD